MARVRGGEGVWVARVGGWRGCVGGGGCVGGEGVWHNEGVRRGEGVWRGEGARVLGDEARRQVHVAQRGGGGLGVLGVAVERDGAILKLEQRRVDVGRRVEDDRRGERGGGQVAHDRRHALALGETRGRVHREEAAHELVVLLARDRAAVVVDAAAVDAQVGQPDGDGVELLVVYAQIEVVEGGLGHGEQRAELERALDLVGRSESGSGLGLGVGVRAMVRVMVGFGLG